MSLGLIPILLAAQVSAAAAQARPARVATEDVQAAQRAVVLGDVKSTREAVERAVQGRTPAERAQIQVDAADQLSRLNDREAMLEAERFYAMSLDTARETFSPERRLQTENNYAAVLMRNGRAGDARTRLESMREQMRKQPRPAQARYLFNYAKAVEQTGDHATALKLYDQALALGPEFEDAALAASRLTLDSPSESIGIPATVSLVDRLIAARQFAAAEQHLLKASSQPRWIGHPQFPLILAGVARYFVGANVDRATFARVWEKPLDSAAQGSPRARARVDDLRRAYAPNGIPLIVQWREARDRFSNWLTSDLETASFVSLLHEVGRQARRAGDSGEALPRLTAAWALSRNGAIASEDAGMSAAVDLANLLLDAGPNLPTGGRILDEIIAQLFEGKGKAYAGRDYASALRFHLLLGSIFERQKRWGPATNPYSALFQWQMALKDHEQLRATGRAGNLAQVPGLHMRLGQAYEAVGERANAMRAYLNASEGFVALKQFSLASDALVHARAHETIASPIDRGRIEVLKKTEGIIGSV